MGGCAPPGAPPGGGDATPGAGAPGVAVSEADTAYLRRCLRPRMLRAAMSGLIIIGLLLAFGGRIERPELLPAVLPAAFATGSDINVNHDDLLEKALHPREVHRARRQWGCAMGSRHPLKYTILYDTRLPNTVSYIRMKAEPEFLTTKEAASWVGRTPRWLHEVRKNPGFGPPYFRVGGRIFYRPSEIMAWMRSRRSE